MLTLNQIHAQIVTLANAHFQIAEVGMGTIAELQGKPDRLYPLLWLSNEGGSLEDNYKVDNIRLTMFGRVIVGEEGQDDDASEIEVLSDMQLILLDFLNYFHQQHGQEYVTDKAATLEHFTERTNDRTAGYSCVLELKQFYDWNKCQIPESGASIPPSVDGLTLYDFCDQSVIDRLTVTQLACLQSEFGGASVTEQINGVTIGTVAPGGTNNQLIQDTAGATVGTEANPSVIADASVTVNSSAFDTVVAEGTIDVPVEYVNGTPVGTINAGVVQIPNPATPPSVSLAISDTTPDFGETITLTATATNFTGAITYHFIVQDYLGNWSKITQVSDNTYDYTCPYAGTFNIHVICEDGSGNTASACESITVGTFAAKYAFTAGWSGVGMSDIVSDRLNSLTDIVSATYTATAPSATERPIAIKNSVTDEASTFRAGDNDNRLQTSLTSIANNVLIAFCFDFTNNEDQGDFNTLTLIGGDGGATEGSRFIVSMRDNSVTRNILFYLINGSVAADAAITETVTHGRNICVMKYDHATTTLRVILNGTTTTASNASGTLWAAAGDYQLLNSRANGRAFAEPVHAIYIKNSASSISDADQDAAYTDLLLKFPNA